ncbi:MAG: phage tail tip lysozyme [Paracoccaceae bacterium]
MQVDPGYLIQGLTRRGLPPTAAQAFVMNFQDESGLNPGINEIAPLVPGSRGGFGLYQLTGPRRVAYENFAQQRGVNPADPDAQMDFLMMELQGPESRAAQSILSAPDVNSAAVAIARDFLRPAPENLAKRVARYTGQQAPSFPTSGNAPQNALMASSGPQTAPQGQQNALAEPQAPQMVDTRQNVSNFLTAQPQQQRSYGDFLRNFLGTA